MENGIKFVIINHKEVFDTYSYKKSIEILEDMTLIHLPTGSGFFGVMPSYGEIESLIGLKAITVFPANSHKGLDTHLGSVMLYSGTTGVLLAVINATAITTIRTAATSALATKYLAKKDASNLTIIGSGVEARSHLFAISEIRNLTKCRVVSRNFQNAKKNLFQKCNHTSNFLF